MTISIEIMLHRRDQRPAFVRPSSTTKSRRSHQKHQSLNNPWTNSSALYSSSLITLLLLHLVGNCSIMVNAVTRPSYTLPPAFAVHARTHGKQRRCHSRPISPLYSSTLPSKTDMSPRNPSTERTRKVEDKPGMMAADDSSSPLASFISNGVGKMNGSVSSSIKKSIGFQDKYDGREHKKLDLQLLLLDNYDSYTYNLHSYLSTICHKPPIVVSNDAYDSWEDLIQAIQGKELDMDVDTIDGIIISPGPGRPGVRDDIGVCLEAIEQNPNLPILGVCLGHQALGHHYNATVKLSPFGPVHGLTSPVFYTEDAHKYVNGNGDKNVNEDLNSYNDRDGSGVRCNLFEGIPQGFDVVRYHSLVVEFPNEDANYSALPIEPIAWCRSNTEAENGDGEICMGLRHKINPHYGVQFHPESVGTGEFGYRILQNFCQFCKNRKQDRFAHDNSGKDISNGSYSNGKVQPLREIVQVPVPVSVSNPDYPTEDQNSIFPSSNQSDEKYKVLIHKIASSDRGRIPSLPSPEVVFENLFSAMDDCFWLDSSTGRKDADLEQIWQKNNGSSGTSDTCPIISNSRFSIMGGNLGPLCKKIEYWGKEHRKEDRGIVITRTGACESSIASGLDEEDIISYLRKDIVTNGVSNSIIGIAFDDEKFEILKENMSVPFDYHGGYVGYLGYEVRHDTRNSMCSHEICGTSVVNEQNHEDSMKPSLGNNNPAVPTAGFLFADRSLVYDHWRDDWYILAVEKESNNTKGVLFSESIEWMRDVTKQMRSMTTRVDGTNGEESSDRTRKELDFMMKRSKDEYAADIARCHEEIRNGESYELCLTNQLSTRVTFPTDSSQNNISTSPFGLYKILRRRNPAPFAAFLKFFTSNQEKHVHRKSAVAICCSSPERFLSVSQSKTLSTYGSDGTVTDSSKDHGWEFAPPFVSKRDSSRPTFMVETKPIKGTTSRIIANEGDIDFESKVLEDKRVAEELRTSVKNRAENLMIVDLLRNDLSRVCEPGSVHVPKLMGIETFATVHQMVSTIRGIVESKYTPIDVIAASFPGGSMTGAPKLRSVDILNELELGNSRGPYSGCLGYISLNGAMDMNIVIRTAVVAPDRLSNDEKSWEVAIGAGGAITALSESDDEFDEMLLKASAIKKSVQEWYDNGCT